MRKNNQISEYHAFSLKKLIKMLQKQSIDEKISLPKRKRKRKTKTSIKCDLIKNFLT